MFQYNKATMSKGRIFLFHWQQSASEALADDLRRLGWEVELEWQDGRRGSQAARQQPPDLLLFDLGRRPSHSWATAQHLAEAAATGELPMLFLDGSPEAIAKTREKILQAVFVARADLPAALEGYAKA